MAVAIVPACSGGATCGEPSGPPQIRPPHLRSRATRRTSEALDFALSRTIQLPPLPDRAMRVGLEANYASSDGWMLPTHPAGIRR